ncbi:MAG: N-acetylornithine carbamoyltransferase [Acidobacteriota bacterium]
MTIERLLATDDLPDGTVRALLDRAADLKQRPGAGDELAGRVLGLVFMNPSLRTRASFEVAMLRHGGHAITIEPGRGVWGFETRVGVTMDGDAAEHVFEAAGVLGRYVDALGVRAFAAGESWAEAREDRVIRQFAERAGVPLVNMESARRHPCQGLADALTLRERLGEPAGRRFVLAWAWHPKPLPTAVPVSASIAAARLGMEVVIARPPDWDLDPDDMAAIGSVAARAGGSVQVTDDLDEAVAGAHAVYAKSWGRLDLFGRPEEEAAARAGLRDWRITAERMERTAGGRGAFLHCLPVRRNVVVDDAVLDGPWSAVLDQAENRLHVQRAVLLAMLGGDGP